MRGEYRPSGGPSGELTTASGLLPAGTVIRHTADTIGVESEIRYLDSAITL